MEEIKIKFTKLVPDAIPFSYSREHDACMDIYSAKNYVLKPKETAIIPSGIAVEIPSGYEGIVRGRSGLASKGISVHLGTIDETYRGNIGIIITNHSDTPFPIVKGNRLAQFTVKPVLKVKLEEVKELSNTERGVNGYGSSGI